MKKGHHQFHSLLHSAELLEKELSARLAPIGVTHRQGRVLNVLNRVKTASQNLLTEQFDVTSGSMSTMIYRLLRLGSIERHKNPADRRGDVITLTPDGAKVLKDVKGVWHGIDDLIEEKLGKEKAAQLAELTRELKFALGGSVPGASPVHHINQLQKKR